MWFAQKDLVTDTTTLVLPAPSERSDLKNRFFSLVPNRSLRLSSRWVADVQPDGGPVAVTVSGAASPAQGAYP